MLLQQTKHTTVITQEQESISVLITEIKKRYTRLKNQNIIVNIIFSNELSNSDIIKLKTISSAHKKVKKSFVLVSYTIDMEKTTDALIVVPTLQEAHDIIEMEEIERDLGF